MATVNYSFGSWVSADPSNDLLPGDTHNWVVGPVNYGDAISLSVHPMVQLGGAEQLLAVENVQMETDPSGRRNMFYTICNVGSNAVDAYGVGYAFVSS
jgi:hypothetical protein